MLKNDIYIRTNGINLRIKTCFSQQKKLRPYYKPINQIETKEPHLVKKCLKTSQQTKQKLNTKRIDDHHYSTPEILITL